jgi:HK97 family phage prohead protease
MPYYIAQDTPDCKSGWAVVDADGVAFGCHKTKQDAIDQAVAISLSTDEPFEGERSSRALPDLSAPQFMRDAAQQGLKYYAEGLAGDGLTIKTVREARAMAAGNVSADKWVGVAAWIARHMADLDSPAADPQSEDYPSAGVVAHLLWGSGPSKEAAGRAMDYANRIVSQLEDARASDIKDNKDMTIRAAVGELAPEDLVRWINGDDVEHGQVISVNDSEAEVLVWDEEDGVWSPTELIALVEVSRLEKIDALPEPEIEQPMHEMAGRSNSFETRVSSSDFEIRETPDGMVFEGYAAVFNSRSENLGGFTEFVAPGAFTRSLKTRNDVKLLWNHDTGSVLGSTRARTLTLTEDARGLKVTAQLPNTQLGRDTAELLKRGDVDSMSFGFNVIKDKWNAQGDERTLEAVRLFEVSIVAFPAYAATAGTATVRSLEKLATRAEVDANALEAALTKLEAGEDLDNDARNLLTSVIDKLSPSATFDNEPDQSVVGDLGLLALKKKKIEFISSL